MALQQDFIVKNGLVVRNTATFANLDKLVGSTTTNIVGQATLNLNFANSNVLDSRLYFTRTSNATYLGADGFIEYARSNQHRIEYSSSSTGQVLGLLIEEQRANLIRYSTNIGNSYNWVFQYGVAGEAGYKLNAGIAPDGTQNATLLYANTSSLTYPNLQDYPTVSSATTYTFSFFVKPVNGKTVVSHSVYDTNTNLNSLYTSYNFSTGAFNTSTGGTTCTFIIAPSVQQYPNGWYRFQTSYSFNSGPSRLIQAKINLDSAGTITPGSGFLLWGAQLEAGTFASSIIPTQTASATRVRDYVEMTGSNFYPWFNPDVGTWYAEFDTLWSSQSSTANQGTDLMDCGVLAINDSAYVGGATSYNGHSINIRNGTTATPIRYITRSGKAVSITGNVDFNLGKYINGNVPYKVVGSYRPRVISIVTAGRPVASGVEDITVAGGKLVFNRLDIGYQRTGGSPSQLNGHIKQIKYWPYVLSYDQQSALTSSTNYTSSPGADLGPRPTYNASTSNFVVRTGIVVKEEFEVPDVDKLYVTTQTTPSIAPSLSLNFLRPVLDPKISFNRASGASYTAADGLIKYSGNNFPRFDYSPTNTGTCLGLLIEESRTNYFLNQGSVNGGTRGIGRAIGPDGTPAWAFTVNASTSTNYPYFGFGAAQSISAGSQVDITFTGYFGPSYGSIQIEPRIIIDLSNLGANHTYNELQINTTNWTVRTNVLGAGMSQIISPTITTATNGMYKLTTAIRYTDDGTLRNQVSTYIQARNTSGSGTYATDGASGLQYALCQAEFGSFPTTYIPTVAAAATRAQDNAEVRGSNFDRWYNNTEGTLYIEADTSFITESTSPFNRYRWAISIAQLDTAQQIGFWKSPNGSNIYVKMADAIASRFETPIGSSITANNPFKAAVSYKKGDQFAIMNAVTSATGTSIYAPSQSARYLRIGNGDYIWNGHIRRILFYPVRLNNTQTQALTVL